MNISLIGMMGCGKSTVGKLLAQKLSFSFVDTDELIVRLQKCSINEIFHNKGEEYFRNLESEVLKNVLKGDNQIISTGGGIVNLPENLCILKEESRVFYLKTSPDILYERVKNDTQRPLLNTQNVYNKIIALLSERDLKYSQAHYIISADSSPVEIVDKIIEKL